MSTKRTAKVEDWLRNYLGRTTECVSSAEIKAAAAATGISEGQLRRTRVRMDSIEVIYSRTTPATTCWQLVYQPPSK